MTSILGRPWSRGTPRWGWVIACALGASVATTGARAQSVTLGGVRGSVEDEAGAPVSGARVIMVHAQTGVERVVVSNRDGAFQFVLIAAGEYELVVEQIGYYPMRVEGVPVRPGHKVSLPRIVLEAAELPVSEIREDRFRIGSADVSRVGVGQWVPRPAFRIVPGDQRDIRDVARLSSFGDDRLAIQGLPARMNTVAVDGVPYALIRHPDPGTERLTTAAYAQDGFRSAELLTNDVDVEWMGVGGAFLNLESLRGTKAFEFSGFVDWTGDALSSSSHFQPSDLSLTSVRGGVVVSGPIVTDTSHAVVGIEARREQLPAPPAWTDATVGDALVAAALDSFDFDLSPYAGARMIESQVVSAFGRFDWQIGAHALGVRASVGGFSAADIAPAAPNSPSVGSTFDGLDVTGGASLTSVLSPALMNELRAAFSVSRREYDAAAPAGGVLTSGGFAFGAAGTLPGEFRRSTVHLSETVHFPAVTHHLKAGVAATFTSIRQSYAYGQNGEFTFGDVDRFSRAEGGFVQSVGRFPASDYFNFRLGVFMQDVWSPVPNFDLTAGMRYDLQTLPTGGIRVNDEWLRRTGLANDDSLRTRHRFAPRAGFTWRVGADQGWIVRGTFGLYQGEVDPALVSELLSHDGGVEIRRGLGVFGAWPDVPDSTQAPVMGPALALIGPNFEAPRTIRTSFGLTRAIGGGAALHLYTNYRHTDFLPRRHDLNRAVASARMDQHGRPIWGQLAQQGAALAAVPGTNRQFSDFDVVSALDPDGFSDYLAFTAAIEGRIGSSVRLLASYTRSGTTDNWLSARDGRPDAQLTPFPDSLGGLEWEDGTSDYDVPDRIVGVIDIAPAGAPLTISAYYRAESGLPFTPGFRDGVDANGDGSARNDPAFVDESVAGVGDVLREWSCLRNQSGAFAARNSCRGPMAHRLDARLAIHFMQNARVPISLVVDAINLIEADVGVRDRALYLVDPDGAIGTAPNGNDIVTPLVVNPDFGQLLVRSTGGRYVRVGIRVNY